VTRQQVAAPGALAIAERLAAERPAFHGHVGEETVWNLVPEALRLIAGVVEEGDRTLEVGSGASTVVFVAAGGRHTAISPFADEHRRIREYLAGAGIDDGRLETIAGRSQEILPTLELPEPVDVALIDGLHKFPHPAVDFHYAARLLRVGGSLLLDDVPIPSVGVVFRFLRTDPGWQLVDVAGDRVALFRKLSEPAGGDDWGAQPFNARMDYGFVAPWRRVRLRARDGVTGLAGRNPWMGRARRRLTGRG
jgi:predicted O-methyltransferase YrrM